MPRFFICFGGLLLNAIVGFFLAQFLAERILLPSQSPSPYGDWRSIGAGLFLGAPMGAIIGVIVGLKSTRQLMIGKKSDFRWKIYACFGASIGIAVALIFSKNLLFELFEGLGAVTGYVAISRALYYLFCGVVGASILSTTMLFVHRFQNSNR